MPLYRERTNSKHNRSVDMISSERAIYERRMEMINRPRYCEDTLILAPCSWIAIFLAPPRTGSEPVMITSWSRDCKYQQSTTPQWSTAYAGATTFWSAKCSIHFGHLAFNCSMGISLFQHGLSIHLQSQQQLLGSTFTPLTEQRRLLCQHEHDCF